MPLIRLNKYLASLGVASRRQIDQFTISHRIQINGQIAILGDKVDPDVDTVIVDKKIIPPHPPAGGPTLVYYLLNKPKFVLSSTSDDRGRKTVLDYVPLNPRVFPVGRLDFESSGLIILTNDGELTLRLTHPRFHLPKTYLVTIRGKVTAEKLQTIRRVPADVEATVGNFDNTQMKITLYQGKKRQIRLLCASLNLFVIDLCRISIGRISLGQLKPGEWRPLSPGEVKSLMFNQP
ncbi:rRNA pseudouridine synthase [Candidatus Shapirobacteria bacterium]|nr:rRNA pseudouridine synthase [Candidatus Shapirobacteria bacterium]